MRNCPAKGRFGRRAFGVNVDPLFVKGGLGKIVDHLLIHGDPVGHADLCANKGFTVFQGVCERGHIWSP